MPISLQKGQKVDLTKGNPSLRNNSFSTEILNIHQAL